MSANWRVPAINLALRITSPVVLRERDLISSIERAPRTRVDDLQNERLEELLHHAWSQTDYYHDVLESCGAVRGGKVDLRRFEDIPFLTKDIIRNQGSRLFARKLPDSRRSTLITSGGTTGAPIQFPQDSGHWDANIGTRIYQFATLGKALGDPEMKVWGNEGDLHKGTSSLIKRMENFVYNRRYQGAWYLSEERINEIIQEINDWRPKLLWCFRDGIDAIAKYVNAYGIPMHQPAAIVLGGSTVYPFVVRTIEQAFKSPVISAYGSREIGGVACECLDRNGHHISVNLARIETIDAQGRTVKEQDAELAITGLQNFAMPFIRYRLGDRGRLTDRPCSCGRTLPLLDSVSGRLIEAFINSRGEQVDPLYFIMSFRMSWDQGTLRQYQLIQEKDGSLTINLVPESGYTLETVGLDLEEIRRKIRRVMGDDCRIEFHVVDDIPLAPSGKFPYIVRRT